ncbi:MAG: RHS repeat protein [Acidobacteria bacterium]|nr:RHS repeat protein [Acidobacteriota bacterium]
MSSIRVSSSFVRSVAFTLCLALVFSGLPFPASTQISQTSPGLKRQLPPNYALPKINDLLTEGRKLHRPDLPRPALKPSTLCGFHDKVCKFKQAKAKKIGQNLRSSGDNSTQVAANAEQQNWLGRIGQIISRAFNVTPFGIPSVSAAQKNSFAASNTLRPATNSAAASMLFTPPNFASLYEARVDPRYRAGTPGEDLFSGNVNYSLPLVSLPGRNGLDLNLSLSFNSAIWFKYSGQMYFDPNYYETLTPGFRLGFPEIEGPFNLTTGETFLVTLPSGKRVEMRIVPSTTNQYEAVDSSYLYLVVNTTDPTQMTLYATDGTQFKYELPTNGYWFRCTQIKDSNGNTISITYKSIGDPEWPLAVTDKVTDTLGREIVFNYDEYLHLLSITQTWQNQTIMWAQFEYGAQTVTPNFGSLGISGPSGGDLIPVITRIITGDGARHTFVYNSWGQAEDFWLYGEADNQRAALDYAFPSNSTVQSDCPRPTQRNDYIANWGGATGNGWVSSYFSFDSANETDGQITDPDGVTHKELFNTANGKRGLTSRMETWSGSALQKFTDITWASDVSSGRPLRPRVTDTKVCDDRNHDGDYDSGTDKLSRTTIDYDTYATTVKLPWVVKQYNEGGQSVYRTTETTYVTDTNYTGITRRIIGLPSLEKLYEGDSTTLKAQTEFVYDSASESGTTFLLAHSNQVRQHDSTSNGTAGNYGTNFSYRGNLTKTLRYSVVSGTASSPIETKTGYYITGSVAFNKIARDSQTTIQTSIFYDDSFSSGYMTNPSPATYAYPTKATDPDGYSSVVKYNYDFGAVTETVDPKSYAASPTNPPAKAVRTYDTKGRLDKSAVWKNGTEYSHIRYVYATDHNSVQTWATVNSLSEENAVLYMLDGVGRERVAVNEHPGSQGGLSAYYRVFDKMGRIVEWSRPTEISSQTWLPTGDDSSYIYGLQTFDWKGRPTIKTNPDTTTTQIAYTGCGCAGSDATELTDETGRKQTIYRDVFGRTEKTESQTSTGGVYSTQTNEYNVRDQVIQINQTTGTSGASLTTTKQYDGYGRLWKSRSPIETGDTVYEYFDDDTVRTITDARQAVATFAYYNRPLTQDITYTVPSGVAATPNVHYTYDENGGRTSMTDGLGTIAYAYDELSQMTSETRQFTATFGQYHTALPGTYKLTYDYNLAGEVKRVGYESSNQSSDNGYIDYAFDKVGNMTGVTGSSFASITSYSTEMKYTAWGEMKSLTYGSTLKLAASHTLRQQLQSLTLKKQDNTSVMDKSYQYYADGRIKFSDDGVNNDFDRAYHYDQVGRLEESWTGSQARNYINGVSIGTDVVPYHLSYQYDVWGNQLAQSGKFWSSDITEPAATYQNLRRDGWQYDAAGNVTNEGGNLLQYDAAGRNVSLREGQYGPESTQSFDGDGLTVRRDPNTTEPIFYLRSTVLGGKVITEINGMGTNVIWTIPRGAKLRSHVYNGETRVATQEVQATSPPTQEMIWRQIDPITGTEITPKGDGSFYNARQEPDPLGSNVGLADPANFPPPAPDPEQPDLFGGGGFNPNQVSYTLDGIRIDEEFARAFQNTAVRAPANEYITIIRHGQPHLARWQAFGDGYQGWVPVGAKYISNGQISYGETAGTTLYKRAPGAPRDTNLAAINKAVGEAYLGKPEGLTFLSGPNFRLAIGQQNPDNKVNPLTVQDDAGRRCMPSEIGEVFLWNKPSGIPLIETPHTFIQTPNRVVGFFAAITPFSFKIEDIGIEFYLGTVTASVTANIGLPGVGEIRDNTILMSDKDYKKSKPYSACPETVTALEKSINDNRVGPYSVTNIGGLNCTGWACKMLKNAGFTPPAPYWLPTLTPADLVYPRGAWRISGLKKP